MRESSRQGYFTLSATLLALLTALGCGSGGPASPDERGSEAGLTQPVRQAEASTDRVLWGVWVVGIERAGGRFKIVPLREADFHLNALPFIEPPALTDLTIDEGTLVVDEAANQVAVDVIITHPFPGMTQYSGFDVRGIVLLPGTHMPFGDPSLIFSGPGEPALLNADGLTRWWNPKEFPATGMFGFQPGLIGQKGGAGVFTATINGYKYFADGLGAEAAATAAPASGRGSFAAGSTNRRRYVLSFGDDPADWLRFQYAVDASWKTPLKMNNPAVPDDFPREANAPEGYAVKATEVENTLWWLDGIGMGGNLKLKLDVYDWRPESIGRVIFEAPGILSQPAVADVVPGSGGGPTEPAYSTYTVDIEPNALTDDGPKDCLITVETTELYTQDGTTVFFGPSGAKVSSYLRYEVLVSWVPPLAWKLITASKLPTQPSTVLSEISVVGSKDHEGVYFFGDDYTLWRYDLAYAHKPEHVTTLAGFFGYSQLDLYGAPESLGRFELCSTGQFVASTITDAPSPTFLGGLKRDYAFFFNNLYSVSGQMPVQIGLPDPTKGFFKFVDVAANWAIDEEKAKIYWIHVDDPSESSPPDPEVTVILGVYQYAFSGNPFSGDVAYLTGSLVPKGKGDGEVDIECVDRFAVDSDPEGVTDWTDLICWFLETDPPALECFSVVSLDDSGDLNEPLTTVHNFHATPRDIAALPTHKGGYSKYNWVVVLEQGLGTWSLETFDQTGASWVGLYDLPGYPACLDVDIVRYQVHVWFSLTPGGPIFAAVFDLDLG